MRALHVGLIVGLVAGLGVGLLLGLSLRPDENVSSSSAHRTGDVAPNKSVAREPTIQRTRVRPATPEPAAEPETMKTGRPAPAGTEVDHLADVSTDELLDRVRAALAGEEVENGRLVGRSLALRGRADEIDLETALALLRGESESGPSIAFAVLDRWPAARLAGLLRAVAAAGDGDVLLAYDIRTISRHIIAREERPPADLVDALLARPDVARRRAGLTLAHKLEDVPLDTIESIVRSDPAPAVREHAVHVAATAAANAGDRNDDATQRRAAAVVIAAIDDPARDVREAAIDRMDDLGPHAGDVALRILRSDGADEEDRLEAMAAILNAGRVADFFATDPSRRSLRECGLAATDADADALRALLPYVLLVLPELYGEHLEELVEDIGRIAPPDVMKRIARTGDVGEIGRINAVYSLLEPREPHDAAEAERRRAGAALFVELMNPTNSKASLRRLLIEYVADEWIDVDAADSAVQPVEIAVRRAATTDENAWVRSDAARLVERWDPD